MSRLSASRAQALPPGTAPERARLTFADASDHGWLRLSGRDRLDLLQRLTTNDFRGLTAPRGLPTVFADPTGKIIAFVIVYVADDSLWLRTMPGQAAELAGYLGRMIFWQDEVEVADLSQETAQYALLGPGWDEVLGATAATALPYGHVAVSVGGADALATRGGPLELIDWMIVARKDDGDAVGGFLKDNGTLLSSEQLELLRIERGLPAWGRELTRSVTPLETNLLPAISFSKGCYTGQEVIARQTNFDKVTRRLVGLAVSLEAPPDLAGSIVRGPGRGGIVTSSARSLALGQVIALALVPRELARPGTVVTVVRDTVEYTAIVSALPFA